MKYFASFLFLLASHFSFCQPAADALKPGAQSLKDRYQLMKSKSQTFQDYKVIKEFVLDGMWKIAIDSVKARKTELHEAQADVDRLRAELDKTIVALKEKEQSTAEIVHDSSHISFFGIDVHKKIFITIIVFVVGGLAALLTLIVGRLKMMHYSMKDKTSSFDSLSKEYEEHKRKALEKQTKLSRELQDERNKLQEMKLRSSH